jgi:hypothetical protein
MNATVQMPRYQSHKKVWALKILEIEVHQDKSASIFPEGPYGGIRTASGWAERFTGSDEDLGYYVVYEGGFASWSPSDAFEGGYSLI